MTWFHCDKCGINWNDKCYDNCPNCKLKIQGEKE